MGLQRVTRRTVGRVVGDASRARSTTLPRASHRRRMWCTAGYCTAVRVAVGGRPGALRQSCDRSSRGYRRGGRGAGGVRAPGCGSRRQNPSQEAAEASATAAEASTIYRVPTMHTTAVSVATVVPSNVAAVVAGDCRGAADGAAAHHRRGVLRSPHGGTARRSTGGVVPLALQRLTGDSMAPTTRRKAHRQWHSSY